MRICGGVEKEKERRKMNEGMREYNENKKKIIKELISCGKSTRLKNNEFFYSTRMQIKAHLAQITCFKGVYLYM